MYVPHVGAFVQRDPLPQGMPILGYSDSAVTALRATMSKQEESNLYAYVADNPVNRTDPSGLLFGFGYGKYCGFSLKAFCPPGSGPPPDDALDAACEKHDCCQCSWWTANPYHLMKCSLELCQGAKDAFNLGCKLSYPGDKKKACDCEKAATAVMFLFCIGAPVISKFPPPPPPSCGP
jgi:hypothetical protein